MEFKLPENISTRPKAVKPETLPLEQYIDFKLNEKKNEILKQYQTCVSIINTMISNINTVGLAYWGSDRQDYSNNEIFKIAMREFKKETKLRGYRAKFSFKSCSESIDCYGNTSVSYTIFLTIEQLQE